MNLQERYFYEAKELIWELNIELLYLMEDRITIEPFLHVKERLSKSGTFIYDTGAETMERRIKLILEKLENIRINLLKEKCFGYLKEDEDLI